MSEENLIPTQHSLLSTAQSMTVAKALVAMGAVHMTTGQPFIYTSGWASPVYIDTRILMSDVKVRKMLMDLAAQALQPLITERGINALIGAESSGIAVAAWLAERCDLPMLYLRKRPLGWGNTARIEGQLPENARLLYVDDVTTDGRSKFTAVESLRRTGSETSDTLVLVDYAIYPGSHERFSQKQIHLHALTSWPHLYQALIASGTLSAEEMSTLEAFSADPVQWSVEHGGVGA